MIALEEPIIDLVNDIIENAIQQNCSDIHIEPFAEFTRIRFRCNGILYQHTTMTKAMSERVITRIKVMANLNIAEKRLPQDGRIYFKNNSDIRVNICPIFYGEKIVLRFLIKKDLTLEKLGLTTEQTKIFREKLSQPQGFILVSGPTGSGKTMSLYAGLKQLNNIEKNIATIEDPIEIDLPGINQINIQPKIGWDFATALKTILRQDPDVVMVGEIRDAETATIAMQAAQTGHLVMSSVHTNSALDIIQRLQTLNIPLRQIVTTVTLLIGQRLLRKLCQHCFAKQICTYCQQGFTGRIGIFECIPMEEELAIIAKNNSLSSIKKYLSQQNINNLWQQGLQYVENNLTTLTELQRVMNAQTK